ncbi:MAG: single-stranded DNA-binding protein [Candidatus Paceibacterota bacterium]|jgi:single-strand DNA-binding protein
MYLNKVFIIGNLTRDPELKALPSGIKVCNFSIATSRAYKDKEGQRQEITDFHNIVAFSKLGELSAQYLKKGQQALVEGRMQTRSWEQNGEKKYRTEIIADNVQFGWKSNAPGLSAPNKADGETEASSNTKGGEETAQGGDSIEYPKEEINPNDIPF